MEKQTASAPAGRKSFKTKFDEFFGITKANSSVKIEILAGLVTFLTMAYILTVNPNQILYSGTSDPRWASIFLATAFGAFFGTLLMALLAKMPFAQAPGMGLNAVVGGVIGGGLGLFGVSAYQYGFEYTFGNAMFLVLISGVIFLIVSVVPVGKNKATGAMITLREKIFDGMPAPVRNAIPVGIGLFIAFIGLQNAGVIVKNQYTIVQLVDFNVAANWAVGGSARTAVIALFGLVVIGILSHFKVKGSIIIGILAATILAIPLGVANIDVLLGKTTGISWKFWESFQTFFSMNSDQGGVFFAAFTQGLSFPAGSLLTSIMLVLTFAMIDMFDTMGTVVGCAKNAGLVDEDGKPNNYNKIMYSDSIATVFGAAVGTSTVTTFVESGAGIAVGGKTGLTALTVAGMFALSIFVLPLFAFIPSAACASALIYVGVLMMSNVVDIDFKDAKNAIPAFITIVSMLLTYSITKGIGLGIIFYVVINFFCYIIDVIKYRPSKSEEKPKLGISVVAFVVFILFLIYFLVPTVILL